MQKCANLVDPETKWMLKNESTLSIRRVDAAANEPQVPEIRVPVNQNRLPVPTVKQFTSAPGFPCQVVPFAPLTNEDLPATNDPTLRSQQSLFPFPVAPVLELSWFSTPRMTRTNREEYRVFGAGGWSGLCRAAQLTGLTWTGKRECDPPRRHLRLPNRKKTIPDLGSRPLIVLPDLAMEKFGNFVEFLLSRVNSNVFFLS